MIASRAIAMIAGLSYGCAGTIEVSGGPSSLRMQLSKNHLVDNIRPLVAGDPAATERLADIAAREKRAKVLFGGQLALLLGCLSVNGSAETGYTDIGIGLCVGSIALGIATLIVYPKQATYGEPLRVYNRNNPGTRYVAPALGVD